MTILTSVEAKTTLPLLPDVPSPTPHPSRTQWLSRRRREATPIPTSSPAQTETLHPPLQRHLIRDGHGIHGKRAPSRTQPQPQGLPLECRRDAELDDVQAADEAWAGGERRAGEAAFPDKLMGRGVEDDLS